MQPIPNPQDRHFAQPPLFQIVIFLILLAFVPLMGALFGSGSQVEQFPLITRLRNPDFLLGDLYVDSAARFGPRFYYAQSLAWLNGFLSLPLIIHSLTVLCNFALGAVTCYGVIRFLGGGALGGMLAAVFAVTNDSFSLGLAGYLRFDSFQPANIAIPLALIGMVFLIRLRPFVALVPLVLAALMHPLVGMEIAMIAYLSMGAAILLRAPENGILRSLMPAIASGLVFGAAMYFAWALPMSGNSTFRMSDAAFFDTLARFRAPHHYLGLSFPRLTWMQGLGFVFGIGLILIYYLSRHGLRRDVLTLILAGLIVLILCAASLWFVDVLQNRLWVTAQMFRMLMVVKWISLMTLGWFMADWIGRDRLAGLIMAGCLALTSADAQPYAVGFVVISAGALALGPRWIRGRLWSVIRWVGLVVLILLCAAANHRYGVQLQNLRAALALAALALIFLPRDNRTAGLVLATVLIATVLGTTTLTRERGLFGVRALQAQFVWPDLNGDEVKIARAAGKLSPPDAIWMVPPNFEAFRMHAGRAVVVDYTSIPFDDAAMREWRARIEGVYGPINGGGFEARNNMMKAYRAGIDWPAAARHYGATHAILMAETPWSGEVLHENESFKAVRIIDAAK